MAGIPPYQAVGALTRKSSPQANATRQALTQVERMKPGLSRHSLSSAHLRGQRELSGTDVTRAMLHPYAADNMHNGSVRASLTEQFDPKYATYLLQRSSLSLHPKADRATFCSE